MMHNCMGRELDHFTFYNSSFPIEDLDKARRDVIAVRHQLENIFEGSRYVEDNDLNIMQVYNRIDSVYEELVQLGKYILHRYFDQTCEKVCC